MSLQKRMFQLVAAGALIPGTSLWADQAAQATYYSTGPRVVNVSGATLFRDFFISNNAGTHDFLDVDGDGRVTGLVTGIGGTASNVIVVDQLGQPHGSSTMWNGTTWNQATASSSSPYASPGSNAHENAAWRLQYRQAGSVNGLRDLINWRNSAAPATASSGHLSNAVSHVNRTQYSTGNGATGPGVATNPGFMPYLSQNAAGASIGGARIDIAPLDVPTSFAVRSGSSSAASWNRGPLESGYGYNPRASAAGQDNQLISTTPTVSGQPAVNFNTSTPDANTVFDTQVAWSPVAFITNRGVGWTDRDADGNAGDVKKSELQHLFVTGRSTSGENLAVATRDSGSGTRNAAMNSIGVDPSFGAGDNLHARDQVASNSQVGAGMRWTNRDSSGTMQNSVRNHRLAVGYSGLQGATAAGAEKKAGRYEILNVQNDIGVDNADGNGYKYVRPGVVAVLDNLDPKTGYQVGGSQTFATVGDPRATQTGNDTRPVTAKPQMQNKAAADYINNITASIASFVNAPADVANLGTPGELLANNFTLVGATRGLSPTGNPESFVANPDFNSSLRAYTVANNALRPGGSEDPGSYGTSDQFSVAGMVPDRTVATGYSDETALLAAGGAAGAQYVTNAGGRINYGSSLSKRNEIAGDFNGDGQRNLGDSTTMMLAYQNRGTATGRASLGVAMTGSQGSGNDAILEVLGDYDANGSFNQADIRYWADGLAMTAGANRKLDRKAGFTAVDTGSVAAGGSANFFSTTLATGKAYAAGDSRGDIAGATGVTVGAGPSGHDGTINAKDIDYVYAQFKTNGFVTDGTANWSNLDEAVGFDLSADMTGDLVVDMNDVAEIIDVVLGARRADFDVDGDVDSNDLTTLVVGFSPLSTTSRFMTGDTDLDGDVDANDLTALVGLFAPAGYGFGGGFASFMEARSMVLSSIDMSDEARAALTAAVPEPSMVALVACGLTGLAARRRR